MPDTTLWLKLEFKMMRLLPYSAYSAPPYHDAVLSMKFESETLRLLLPSTNTAPPLNSRYGFPSLSVRPMSVRLPPDVT